MRRTAIAAAWILGTTVPTVVAMVLVFGCCVLPFHGVVHKVMPVCHVAMELIRGGAAGHQDDAQPARAKQEPGSRMASSIPRAVQWASQPPRWRTPAAADPGGYRTFISLGALRCDQDVGLHLLAGALLI
jgi:hypothetical protein